MVLQEFKKEFLRVQESIFQYYKFIHTCVLFAILLSYFHMHFKSSRQREREKKPKSLVYIFVRETQIFIDKQKARCWSLFTWN